jgi:hypothetical protein
MHTRMWLLAPVGCRVRSRRVTRPSHMDCGAPITNFQALLLCELPNLAYFFMLRLPHIECIIGAASQMLHLGRCLLHWCGTPRAMP